MSISIISTAAPKLQADDAEIERYAVLLDCLGVGLLVYGVDAEVCLRNGYEITSRFYLLTCID
ncbi:hypothetical protein, partial [Propionivibrio sp.]|uniref:hypothetical protein n=1 Tax=Propionivibrio sp. TaxID=2212460 RepID=UPI003BF0BFC5